MPQASASSNREKFNDLTDYFHGAPIGLKLTGPDGTITQTNLAELKLLGYDEDMGEYVGRHIAEFHSDPDAAQALLDRLVRGEKVVEHETTLLRRDGTPQKVLLYANARIDDGKFHGVRCCTFPHPEDLRPDIAEVGALTDLSAESRALDLTEDEQQRLYSELSDFFDNSPVNLHIVGGDGLVKHASESELEAMGYDRSSYIGQHIAGFHTSQSVINGMLEDLVGGTPLINFAATLAHKDGSELPVMIYSNSRMRGGSFINTRCFTVSMPKARKEPADRPVEFVWPRNEDFGFSVPGKAASQSKPNPMTLALRYIASRKRPEESLGFLASVSKVFESRDRLDTMLAEVAALSVPFLADFVSIDTAERHLTHASIQPLRDRVEGIVACLGAGEKFSLQSVRSGGKVEACFDLSAETNGSTGRAAEFLNLGLRSLILVPLRIRDDILGTLSLLRENASTRRNFGPADRALAEELARRISFAIEIERISERMSSAA
jgi:PAS domain S-box-containing protein